MATALKTRSNGSIQTQQTSKTEYQEPKRLSKAAIWRLNNPGGIIIVHDRRAVNR